MENSNKGGKTIPMILAPQIVPSRVCFSCDVCCRFPEQDSSFRPFFSKSEIQQAIASGIDPGHFPDSAGSQIAPVPNPSGEGYVCPAFDPGTSHCRIYNARPLDCQLYPFLVMWDQARQVVQLGWDTKCPYLMDRCSAPVTRKSNAEPVPLSYSLPETLQRFSQIIAERVESQELIDILSAAPQLVMEYQNDVVVFQNLPRLTQALSSKSE